jgi:hypothetical protein
MLINILSIFMALRIGKRPWPRQDTHANDVDDTDDDDDGALCVALQACRWRRTTGSWRSGPRPTAPRGSTSGPWSVDGDGDGDGGGGTADYAVIDRVGDVSRGAVLFILVIVPGPVCPSIAPVVLLACSTASFVVRQLTKQAAVG